MTLPLKAKTIVTEVLDLLNPYSVYLDCFKFYQNSILFEGGSFDIKGNLHLFSLGKAASHELKALKSIIKSETSLKIASAVAYTKTDHLCDDDEIYQLAGSHPLLTEKNIELTKLFIDFISEIPKEDTLIFLLSGGGSALLELPVEGLSFQELQQRHKDILNSGLNINEMNQRRRELSLIKGGGLKNFIKTKNILQIITCDIPNEDPFDVSSGPLLGKEDDENPRTLITQSASILLKKLTVKENFIDSLI